MLINDVIRPQKTKRPWYKRGTIGQVTTRIAAFAHKLRTVRKSALVITGLVIVIGLLLFFIFHHGRQADFPKAVNDQVTFSILYPENNQEDKIDPQKATITYSATNKAISYDVLYGSTKIVVTQQRTPEIFDEKGVYSFKLSQARQYESLDTRAGQVYLTRPKELQGATLAWLNSDGTLLLARSLSELSARDWTQFFNTLVAVK